MNTTKLNAATQKLMSKSKQVNCQNMGEVARFPYTKNLKNRVKSKANKEVLDFYGIQEVFN